MAELGIHIPSLAAYLVNFTLVLVLLYLFAYKPILRMIDQRNDQIRESLDAADEARKEAARTQETLRGEMDAARREARGMIDEARRVSERIRVEEQAKAQAELQALREKALEEIQRERDGAIEEVRKHFVDLAVTAAERVVQESLDRQKHQALVRQVLDEADSLTRQRGA